VTGRLQGKVTLITGTAGGQGAVAARLFAREGATVIGCDIDAERALAVAEEVRAAEEVRLAGGAMTAMGPVDLADPEQATRWIDDAVKLTGGIDVLYNNASAPRVGPFSGLSFEDWRFTIRNELDLIFTVTSAAWPHLITRGGATIINTASVSAHRGAQFVEQAAHGAAKGGVLAITRHLAASGAPHGVRANSISPGLIVTAQIAGFLKDPSHPMHEMARQHPLGRLGDPDDVARVALFLASDDAAYLNAVDIVVDGGQSLIS
jgi:meso-butanediol dehydrogenase/(S,S)-butanediol dehydrogenase/diacetyl reductase